MDDARINIIKEKSYADYSSNGASPSEIVSLIDVVNIKLDDSYLDFLKKINGFELNGLNFYGTTEKPKIYVYDVVRQNDFWSKQIPQLSEYFIIGDGDMEFYCYNPSTKKYYALMKVGLTVVEIFDDFSSMMDRLLVIYG